MKHHVGLELAEELEHPVAIANVGQQQVRVDEHCGVVDRQLHRVQAALIAVEHHQRRGLEVVQLAAQLAANRPAGACHEHPPPGDVVRHRFGIDVGRMPTQQVLGCHGPNVGKRHRPEHLLGLWQHQEGQPGLVRCC